MGEFSKWNNLSGAELCVDIYSCGNFAGILGYGYPLPAGNVYDVFQYHNHADYPHGAFCGADPADCGGV